MCFCLFVLCFRVFVLSFYFPVLFVLASQTGKANLQAARAAHMIDQRNVHVWMCVVGRQCFDALALSRPPGHGGSLARRTLGRLATLLFCSPIRVSRPKSPRWGATGARVIVAGRRWRVARAPVLVAGCRCPLNGTRRTTAQTPAVPNTCGMRRGSVRGAFAWINIVVHLAHVLIPIAVRIHACSSQVWCALSVRTTPVRCVRMCVCECVNV